MHIILIVILGYTFINIFETVYYTNYGETYFGASLTGTWLIYIGALLFLILFLIFRRYNQNKYTKIANENVGQETTVENHYYYQMPMIQLMDNMPIKVKGENNPKFELYLNSVIHKFLFIFNLSTAVGLKLTTDENVIILKTKKHIRYKYEVYINGKYSGEFNAQPLISKKGINKYLNFTYENKDTLYHLTNDYFELTAYIKEEENTLLSGNRTYFNFFSKDGNTGKRGEKHDIYVAQDLERETKELLLSFYVAALNIRNF